MPRRWLGMSKPTVLIVGFGGAGAAAAVEAREQGLDVVAIDQAEGGGATLASGGVFYAGGGTAVQRQCGEQDSPENMQAYLELETQGVVSDATLQRFCRGSAADLDWLMRHGVKFGGPVWKSKTSYPNVNYFLYHPDNSLLPAAAAVAKPAARGHRGMARKGNSAVDLGGAIYSPLKRSALQAGAVLECKTEARQLIMDSQRRGDRRTGVATAGPHGGLCRTQQAPRPRPSADAALPVLPARRPGGACEGQ